jgi:hypothetical protein
MNRLKTSLTCSKCLKLYKNPIELPCKHFICNEHLSENKLENKIKCDKCKKDFQVKDNDFKSTDLFLNKLISEQLYLNDEEVSLKIKIEESIKVFFNIYEQFLENKNNLNLECHNHFHEIRFQIDEQREELKQKIDDIALDMIEKTKKYEADYFKSLNAKLDASLKSLEIKSLENELNEMEETFRDPNILLGEIREMHQKREKSISEIKEMLNEISQVKDNLKETNQFRKNFSMNQDSIGWLSLNEYSPFKSQILADTQVFDLIKLCQFSPKDSWSLLYRGTRDGFSANNFHSKCDGHSSTLMILKARRSSYIFGGFTSQAWQSTTPSCVKADPNAFLFSLTNKDNTPCLMRTSNVDQSIVCNPSYGAVFGPFPSPDIVVFSSNASTGGVSNLGKTYSHPHYFYGSDEAKTFLAGSESFHLSEMEVYRKDE